MLAAGGVALFAVSVPLARLQYAGHAKHGVRPLDAPERFRRSVEQNLLSAGVLEPTQAPQDAVTALS